MRQQAQLAGPVEIAFFTALIMAACFAARRAVPRDAAAGRAAARHRRRRRCSPSARCMLLSWAYARAEAQRLAPVEYTGFIWAAIFGFLIFAEPVPPLHPGRRGDDRRRLLGRDPAAVGADAGGGGGRLMAWLPLILGGLFEVGFTTCLRFVDGFRNLPWTLGFLVSVTLSMGLLERAARDIPMGTAYAVWGGIGAAGTVLVGIFWFGEPVELDPDPPPPRPHRLHRRPEADRGMSFDEGLYAWVQEALEPARPR